MAFFEIILYGLNNAVVVYCGLADIGGTYVIHMFGAYFGLTVSRILDAKASDMLTNHLAINVMLLCSKRVAVAGRTTQQATLVMALP